MLPEDKKLLYANSILDVMKTYPIVYRNTLEWWRLHLNKTGPEASLGLRFHSKDDARLFIQAFCMNYRGKYDSLFNVSLLKDAVTSQ